MKILENLRLLDVIFSYTDYDIFIIHILFNSLYSFFINIHLLYILRAKILLICSFLFFFLSLENFLYRDPYLIFFFFRLITSRDDIFSCIFLMILFF